MEVCTLVCACARIYTWKKKEKKQRSENRYAYSRVFYVCESILMCVCVCVVHACAHALACEHTLAVVHSSARVSFVQVCVHVVACIV